MSDAMNEPDLSTLPKRMRYAADVLEEAAERAQIENENEWTPTMLRADASIWENLDNVAEQLQAQQNALMQELHDTLHDTGFAYGEAATRLIQRGWRKVESND
jgi:hypothetical protein